MRTTLQDGVQMRICSKTAGPSGATPHLQHKRGLTIYYKLLRTHAGARTVFTSRNGSLINANCHCTNRKKLPTPSTRILMCKQTKLYSDEKVTHARTVMVATVLISTTANS